MTRHDPVVVQGPPTLVFRYSEPDRPVGRAPGGAPPSELWRDVGGDLDELLERGRRGTVYRTRSRRQRWTAAGGVIALLAAILATVVLFTLTVMAGWFGL